MSSDLSTKKTRSFCIRQSDAPPGISIPNNLSDEVTRKYKEWERRRGFRTEEGMKTLRFGRYGAALRTED
jgi:hypothetical protein